MTSRPPPRTRSTRSRCSVSTSRNSMSAWLSRRNAKGEHGDSPAPGEPSPRHLHPGAAGILHEPGPGPEGTPTLASCGWDHV